ncbi:16S rRNA (cytidine(1402)-2'-O)-methyltransferase [Chloroflexota bacterium]
MFTLYIVATPIGNVEDISLRALRILSQVKLIAAEDTRKTRRLLTVYGIKTRLTSYHEHNKEAKLSYLLHRLELEDLALVAEAGMPGISDPGYELVVAASERRIPLVPIPGPSVLITALAISGLPINQFTYLGFFPRRKGPRKRLLEQVAEEERTMLALEAPHRLVSTLDDILEFLGDRRIAVCRELTKIHEEVFRGTVREAMAHFREPKGEFTLVIAGRRGRSYSFEEAEQQLRQLCEKGVCAKEAILLVANAIGASKKQLYRSWLSMR